MKTKKSLTILCLLFYQFTSLLAQTNLSKGDLFLLYINSSGDDQFGFVPLKDLQAGTILYFTDKGWDQANNTFRGGEGIAQYTVPAGGIMAGTVIHFDFGAISGDFSVPGGFRLSTSGDQLFVFQDMDPANAVPPEDEPEFIFAINLASRETGDNCTAANSNDSGIPPGLSPVTFGEGIGYFLALGENTGCRDEEDRVVYKGPFSFSDPAMVFSNIGNPDNWLAESGTTSNDYTCYEMLIKGTSNIFLSPQMEISGNNLAILSGDYLPQEADNTDFGTVDVFSGPLTKTFTIHNTGMGTLTHGIPAVSLRSDKGVFFVSLQPDKGIIANGTATFTIAYDPRISGQLCTDTVIIQSNDSNNGSYQFAIQGSSSCTEPVISLQPEHLTGCLNGNSTIEVAAQTQNGGNLKFQWQSSTDDGISFSDLTDSEIYSDTDQDKLNLTGISREMDGQLYRVIIREISGVDTCQTFSDAAILRISNPTISGQTHPPTCTENNDGRITLTIDGGTLPYSYLWSNGAESGGFTSGLRAGSYSVTITDANNCRDSTAFTLPASGDNCPTGTGPCGDLYFSEYLEGSGFNKALEIYNPTLQNIYLANYSIAIFTNGNSVPMDSFTFGNNTLAPGKTFVIAHTKSDLPAITSAADTLLPQGTILNFNGDDALLLIKETDTLDAIGIPGKDPGSGWAVAGLNGVNGNTKDFTLIRSSVIKQGQTNWNAGHGTEWNVFPRNSTNSLGMHTQKICTNTQLITHFDEQVICHPTKSEISIGYTAGGDYMPANQFIVQISDTAGSFQQAQVIGTLLSQSTTGQIAGLLPATLPYSTKYRIRIIATAPPTEGMDNGRDIQIAMAPNISGRDTAISGEQAIDLSLLINGTQAGIIEYSTNLKIWTNNSLQMPASKTIYYVRDSLPESGCSDTARIEVTLLGEPQFHFDDTDGDGQPDFGDPCSCEDPENLLINNILLFHDIFTIQSQPNESWVLSRNDGEFLNSSGLAVPLGTAISPLFPGSDTYQIRFYHRSGIAAQFAVSRNGSGTHFDQESSVCLEPLCKVTIPTFSQWGLIIFGLLVVNIGLYLIVARVPVRA